MPQFDVLMVSIEWEAPHKARNIIPSKKFLEPSATHGNHYEFDIVLYTKEEVLYYQFAIKTNHTPLLKDNQGRWNSANGLFKIQDDLWIIKGEWRIGQRGIGYHHCPSINSIGKIEIGISENLQSIHHFVTIDINSNIEDFDFSQLKNDFEGELWNLITSNKSTVSSDKIEITYCDKIFRFPENKSIIEFLKTFDQISKNPKHELSFSKELRKSERAVPVVETYRKLSTMGTATLLPSKSAIANYNLFENRFVCFMLHSIYLIVSKNVKYTRLQIERLQSEILHLNNQIATLGDPDPKVDPEKIQSEVSTQMRIFEDWKTLWEYNRDRFLRNYNTTAENFNELVFQISGIRYYNGQPTFWGNKLNGADTGWCALVFESNPEGLFEDGKEITVRFFAAYYREEILVGKTRRLKYTIWAIRQNSLEYVNSYQEKIISRQRFNLTTLQNNNWRQFSILSAADRNRFNQERNNQILTLKKRIEKIKVQVASIDEFSKEQSELLPLIIQRRKSAFFKGIKWKNFQGFKPSMTFIQNIAYRNALRYYKEILKSEGIDIEVFDLYENVTSYGLREMPQVYELWCLVTQIKVLSENFHFAYHAKDITALLKHVEPKKQTINEYSVITFSKDLAERKVTLHYQKSIADDKRPDFILKISCRNRTINLILDSKFKNYNYKKSIIYETIEMTDKYAGHENYVFILHPCKDGIFEGRNIRYTNHGGERIFYGEGEEQQVRFPFHEYGYIELKPNYTDTLKKLIAMSFEYLLESSRNAREDGNIDPKPEYDMFCINCGKTNISITQLSRGTNRHYYNCSCLDKDCGHKIYIDYCWNCKTKLFKHGSYWDYHLESTWSIFDIRCPNCGMTVADRPQIGEF